MHVYKRVCERESDESDFLCQTQRALGFRKLWPAKRAWLPNSSSILHELKEKMFRSVCVPPVIVF